MDKKRLEFAKQIGEWVTRGIQARLYTLDSEWIANWLGVLVSTFFFVFGSFALIEKKHYGQGHMTTGTFVALLAVYTHFGKALGRLFAALLSMETAALSLDRICDLINSATGEEKHQQAADECLAAFFPNFETTAPQTHIRFEHVAFEYEAGCPVISDFSGVLPLGGVVSLRDSSSSGKRTLLRMIVRDLIPTSGLVLCPPNLRVSMLDDHPVVLQYETLFNNVMAFAARWVLPKSGWELAKTLGIENGAGQPAPEMKAGRTTPKIGMIVSIARVLLSDPDVLIVMRARWPAGAWQAQVLKSLVQWQRLGLRKMLGCHDTEDDSGRIRTLILAEEHEDPYSIDSDHVISMGTLIHAARDAVTPVPKPVPVLLPDDQAKHNTIDR